MEHPGQLVIGDRRRDSTSKNIERSPAVGCSALLGTFGRDHAAVVSVDILLMRLGVPPNDSAASGSADVGQA